MTAFTAYTAGWGGASPAPPVDTVIGPDKNLWGVSADANIYKFDVVAHTTTTYPISGAHSLISVCTDGTFIYAVDENATGSAFPLLYKITTAGVNSAFYTPAGFEDGGSVYFDGTYLWVTSTGAFRQFSLAGALVNSYARPSNIGGGLINDGTYWWSGSIYGGHTGVSRAAVGAPGAWTDVTSSFTAGDPTFIGELAIGDVWVGNQDNNIYSVTPPSTVTSFAIGASQSFQSAYDGSALYVATLNGIWVATPGAPGTGAFAGILVPPANGDTQTILYDPPSNTVWATGITGVQPYTYTLALPNPNQLVLLT